MNKSKILKQLPEFYNAYHQGVTAIYVVNPDLLALDDPAMRGKPFLFVDRTRYSDLCEGYGNLKVYSGFGSDIEELLKGRIIGNRQTIPPTVKIGLEEIEQEEVNSEDLYSSCVPFAAGAGHIDAVKRTKAGEVIARTDLPQFKKVLEQYDQARAKTLHDHYVDCCLTKKGARELLYALNLATFTDKTYTPLTVTPQSDKSSVDGSVDAVKQEFVLPGHRLIFDASIRNSYFLRLNDFVTITVNTPSEWISNGGSSYGHYGLGYGYDNKQLDRKYHQLARCLLPVLKEMRKEKRREDKLRELREKQE